MVEGLVLGAVAFIAVDMRCYGLAKWPERMRGGMWPGSGIYALMSHGRSKDIIDPRGDDA